MINNGYWTNNEKELYDKWKGVSKKELLDNVFELALGDTSEQEVITIVELCKKACGLEYELPSTYSKQELLDFGVPENEILEAKK